MVILNLKKAFSVHRFFMEFNMDKSLFLVKIFLSYYLKSKIRKSQKFSWVILAKFILLIKY